jgi:hypothetical protein
LFSKKFKILNNIFKDKNMKILRSTLLSLFILACGGLSAGSFSDRHFDQDHMIPLKSSILTLSAFDEEDHITSYSDFGTLLWDVKINSKIISWKLKDGLLYAFAKSRYLEKTYLICIDPASGIILWERP